MLEKFLKNGKKNMEYSIKLADQFLDESKKIVYVEHIYYGGRNYLDSGLL